MNGTSKLYGVDDTNRLSGGGPIWKPVNVTPDGDLVTANKSSGFKPSSYEADLTMNGTAQSVQLAAGVKEGAGRIYIVNRGATTEAIRVTFGSSASNAESNLNISGGAATTGFYIPAGAENGSPTYLAVPDTATHYAIANAVAGDTQVVSVTQGV